MSDGTTETILEATAPKPKEGNRNGVGWAVLFGFFISLGALYVTEVPVGNKEVILVLIGQVSGAFATVVGYNFNTTVGSSRKTEMLGAAVGSAK